MIVQDVPSRRSAARILTESLGDHAGNIPISFLFVPSRQIAPDSLTVTPFLGVCLRLAPS